VENAKEIEAEEKEAEKTAEALGSESERSVDTVPGKEEVSDLIAEPGEEEEEEEGQEFIHARVNNELDKKEEEELRKVAEHAFGAPIDLQKNPGALVESMVATQPNPPNQANQASQEGQASQGNPPNQPIPFSGHVHTLANLPHYHVVMWITSAVDIDWTDSNQIQRLLLPYFDDVNVSRERGKYLQSYMGTERYWLIASDCNLLGDLIWATNGQATAAGPPSRYSNGRHPELNPWRRFRQSYEHVHERKVEGMQNFLKIYENYLWYLRTLADGRSGFPSLSDRYDRAQLTESLEGPQLGCTLSAETLFNMKFNNLLYERDLKLWNSPTGMPCLMQRRAYKDDSGFDMRMRHSYEPVRCPETGDIVEGVNEIKSYIIRINAGWAERMIKHGGKAGWDKDDHFKSIVMRGFCSKRILRLNYHWVEGPTWYYYVIADPNAPNPEREALVKSAIKDEEIREAAYQRGNKRNLPVWFPLPASCIDDPRMFSLERLKDPRDTPHPDQLKPRILMNGFLYKDTEYLDHVTAKLRSVDDLVKEQLNGEECGFCDPRLESFEALTGRCRFDCEYLQEAEAKHVRLPTHWLSVANFYGLPPCSQHKWKKCRAEFVGDENSWVCAYKGCGRHALENRAQGQGTETEPHEKHLATWGPYAWEHEFMDNLRNCVLPDDYYHKQRAVALIGEKNTGKSSLTRPFSVEGRIYLHNEIMVPGDGTKADMLAGLHDNARFFLGAEFRPKKTFPDPAILKKFLEGGKISSRGMRENSAFRDCDFPKLFDMNFEYRGEVLKDKQTKEVTRVETKVRGWNYGVDDGNPFGPDYDPSTALQVRIAALITRHQIAGAQAGVIEKIGEDSMDVAFYLWELRYIDPEQRYKWRRES
jgi:hypothetical protein